MHPVSIVITLCVGNFIAWMAAMYVKDAAPGLIGHVITSTLGAFIAGFLALTLLPQYGVPGMMIAEFIGAIVLLYFVRLRKLNHPPSGERPEP